MNPRKEDSLAFRPSFEPGPQPQRCGASCLTHAGNREREGQDGAVKVSLIIESVDEGSVLTRQAYLLHA